ncbi:MAG: hypothetical protein BWX88_02064 [Planctomycetes bacterium ADurb.Bin126]|nr:MAG: hypothetical protein BWX88_02064 [Planctomycetes bacterium ADurb.Bin126]HOD81854.1 hypothetical protein [Phycisphaerae bacterium]HQL75713.1 hypothetical protein [Phycisphaerae bacterium]
MRRFFVTGLVKLADRVRRELSHPIAPGGLKELRELVERTRADIAEQLAREGMTARNMPAPTRRAYLFLAGLDWDAVNVDLQEHASGPPPGSVFFSGLERTVKNLTARLGSVAPSGRGELLQSLRETALRVERQCVNLQPHQIKPKARALRGWLAYFAQAENFERYVSALAPARDALGQAAGRAGKTFPGPANIRFVPMSGIYRVRFGCACLEADLATPLICLTADDWHELAGRMFTSGRGMSAYLERIVQRNDYRNVQAGLEAGGGVVECSRGLHHDLAASFERVNAEYFAGRLARPRLTWSGVPTRRKLGHYDRAHDTVMVSSALDAPRVPGCAVDFIMYHELLHKAQDNGRSDSRRIVHDAKFQRDEKRFRLYDQAKAALAKVR